MSFRARLTLVAAAAVALAVVVASIIVYIVVRHQLRSQVDDAVRAQAVQIANPNGPPLRLEPGPAGQYYLDVHRGIFGGGFVQLVGPHGKAFPTFEEIGSPVIPVSKHALGVAQGKSSDTFLGDASVSGRDFRVLTMPVHSSTGQSYALQIAQDLSGVNHSLATIRKVLFAIGVGGIAIAAALGLLVSRAALAPVRRMMGATEKVTETGDLSERIETHGADELSRLGASFNRMLAALEDSTRKQRQLVADASHELRTPLTSLRTNIEVLAGERTLPPGERERLLHDVVEQLGEMTTLVAELIELARAEEQPDEPEDVRLDLVAADAVERARRNLPGIDFETDLQVSLIHGVPSTIERAVANLLDNAAKWSPPGGPVEVGVRDGTVTVRDHGPGIAEEDLPFVFDRFYRARSARGMPGSGLGLAIVRQVAEKHGGEVVAEPADGGGTQMTLRLNGRPPAPEANAS
jgi:two-component system, OmpR family, sensor histidine kinase MprB